MRPAEAVKVQENVLRALQLQPRVPLFINEIRDPERCIHLRRLRVWLVTGACEEGYVRGAAAGTWRVQVGAGS